MSYFKNLASINEKIREYKTIIIHRHVRPDPDALGSQIGLAEFIKNEFDEKEVYVVGEERENLKWIGEMDNIPDEKYKDALVFVLDTSTTDRISDQRYKLGKELIKIDHHPEVEKFGDISVVMTDSDSCSEIVFDLIGRRHIDVKTVKAIYAGIVGDTGRFMFPSENKGRSLAIASMLANNMESSDVYEINRKLSEITFEQAKLIGQLYESMVVNNDVASSCFTNGILDKFGITADEASLLVNKLGDIETVKAYVLFVQQPDGTYRARLRSKEKPINQIAQRFGGGGHPLASGVADLDLKGISELYKQMVDLYK